MVIWIKSVVKKKVFKYEIEGIVGFFYLFDFSGNKIIIKVYKGVGDMVLCIGSKIGLVLIVDVMGKIGKVFKKNCMFKKNQVFDFVFVGLGGMYMIYYDINGDDCIDLIFVGICKGKVVSVYCIGKRGKVIFISNYVKGLFVLWSVFKNKKIQNMLKVFYGKVFKVYICEQVVQ